MYSISLFIRNNNGTLKISKPKSKESTQRRVNVQDPTETYEALNVADVAQQNAEIYEPLGNGMELRQANNLETQEKIYQN